jgi:hypothetical protein
MRTKRQPTIKTLLLLMAVGAVLFASVPTKSAAHPDELFVYFIWSLFVSGMFFWLVLPLMCGLCLRSPRVSAAVCFGVGTITAVIEYFARIGVWYLRQGDRISEEVYYILFGSFDGLALLMYSFESLISTESQFAKLVMLWSVCLIIYAGTCFLIAKSCRLRVPNPYQATREAGEVKSKVLQWLTRTWPWLSLLAFVALGIAIGLLIPSPPNTTTPQTGHPLFRP